MEASGIREFPHNFFRFPTGLSFHSKFRAQSETEEGTGHFLSALHGLLPGPPRSLELGHGSPGKPSFSIDSLLGLKDQGGRGGQAEHVSRLTDWKTQNHPIQGFHPNHLHLQHHQEEGRKTKLGLRFPPYKRERKGAQHQEGKRHIHLILVNLKTRNRSLPSLIRFIE